MNAFIALIGIALAAGAEPRSTVILPPQTAGIKFDHKLHIEQFDLACTDCHGEAVSSEKSSDHLIPKEAACARCHEAEVERASGDCEKCHQSRNPISTMVIPAPNLRFPHKIHVERKIACTHCHATVPGVALATRDELPLMATCRDCHNDRQAPGDCTTCHLGAGGGRIRTRYPSGTLKPKSHDAGWWQGHRAAARMDERECQVCHQQTDCTDCHRSGQFSRGGVPKPDFHPNDWILTHGRAAYSDDPTCSSCHAKEKFCRDCHDGFKASEATFPAEDRQFHPAGWASFSAGPEHHSHVARRNVTACGACHQEENCLECHSTRTFGYNPHPKGFDPGRLKTEHRAMCERCHEPDSPELD